MIVILILHHDGIDVDVDDVVDDDLLVVVVVVKEENVIQ